MSTELDQVLKRSTQERIGLTELDGWFASLPAVEADFMLGRWRGGVFNTGHPGEPLLGQLRWVGKNFNSTEAVDPIVCEDAQGQRVVNPVMGSARLRMVVPPGATGPTASMVYDVHPIIDHFKRLDNDSVLGVMDRRGDSSPLYFWLRRLP
ncbi:protein of unknown function [Roseateles sp. YR242]|uniref:GXWXG domain-containing protein n=1 Tax=Roseateles sp. YR242 TaxID=1855305 RepID=UPI0008B16255|nr:GXWXG domain-containing protein [Roseateles sp. YR242]SEL23089.1 protein of unknown function [Roseateles sp. YR242]